MTTTNDTPDTRLVPKLERHIQVVRIDTAHVSLTEHGVRVHYPQLMTSYVFPNERDLKQNLDQTLGHEIRTSTIRRVTDHLGQSVLVPTDQQGPTWPSSHDEEE